MATIRVQSSAGAYEVVCARGALRQARRLIERLGESTGTFVVSSPRVWRLWGREAERGLGVSARRAILFADSEAAKRLATVEGIARALVRAGADRRCTVVAVGGGVVGDVAGFAAATYLRGVRVVHVPTTLVAQVDSAIGGKTGVDLAEGKNLVGAFHPPALVIADPETLRTLPHREYRSGLYEVIKYGVIADAELFEFLERRMDAVVRRDAAALDWIIPRCIAIKARVVSKDEHEAGSRKILNFGHTLGHAYEAATRYKRFLHGEAVACGMIAATLLAGATRRLPFDDCFRILRGIGKVGPVPDPPRIPAAELRGFLASDKKSRAGQVRWVLPRRIGQAQWDMRLPEPMVRKAVKVLPLVVKEQRENEGEMIIGIVRRRRRGRGRGRK